MCQRQAEAGRFGESTDSGADVGTAVGAPPSHKESWRRKVDHLHTPHTHITTLCLHITLSSLAVSDSLRRCKELNLTDSRQVTTAVLRYDHAYDITAILDYSLFAPRRLQLRLSRYLNTDSRRKNSNCSRDIQILKVIEKESKDISFNFNEQPLGGVRLHLSIFQDEELTISRLQSTHTAFPLPTRLSAPQSQPMPCFSVPSVVPYVKRDVPANDMI